MQIKNNNCLNHPNKKAISFCHICNNYYCEECLIEGREYYYCHKENCFQEYKKDLENFLESYDTNPRFCPQCIKETSDESTGDINSTNLVGTKLVQIDGGTCLLCKSIIVEKQYEIFGFRVKSFGFYRVIQFKKYRTDLVGSKETIFYARKLLNQKKILL
ncbi:MAG TPA: hypothetical protein DHV28_08460 [Ignavibacteriales bacterium]|nr:hypothetical protein [Ignavibacteriales bacterium]